MVFGTNVVWRYPFERDQFSLCDGSDLTDGYIMLADPEKRIHVLKNAFYKPVCYNKGPMLSTFKDMGVPQLPSAVYQWQQFIQTESGSFKYSIYPFIYSLTVSTVMCIFLTIIVFTNHTQNPSILLRSESGLASINLGILFVRAIVFLSRQHELGYSSGEKLLASLQSDEVFSVIDFIVVLMAQFAQVQVIIRVFSRVKEKRVSFIVGGFLSICAQTIWGISTFASFDQETDSDISILPAFTYLLRIALSMMYCGLIIIYGFSKRSFVFNQEIVMLTILTFLVINLQFAFFITDIANVWVSELSEIFNTTIYVSVTVIPWEWINRVHALERIQQTEGILGRPVYEEEYHDIARYQIINDYENQVKDFHDHSDHNNGNDQGDNHSENSAGQLMNDGITASAPAAMGTSNAGTPMPGADGRRSFGTRLKDTLAQTTNSLLYFTDQVIAYGLAVPRSVSVNSTTKRMERKKKKRPAIVQGRKEVFVYSKKEVVCDSDNEQTETATTSSDREQDHDDEPSLYYDHHITTNTNTNTSADTTNNDGGGSSSSRDDP